ncbi:hypothetical protein B0H13DRAFT_745226 [Mycena leptocephala]|nr:hypothetical protein B0H13DRAFT_745226 [Mycena leptocephala]
MEYRAPSSLAAADAVVRRRSGVYYSTTMGRRASSIHRRAISSAEPQYFSCAAPFPLRSSPHFRGSPPGRHHLPSLPGRIQPTPASPANPSSRSPQCYLPRAPTGPGTRPVSPSPPLPPPRRLSPHPISHSHRAFSRYSPADSASILRPARFAPEHPRPSRSSPTLSTARKASVLTRRGAAVAVAPIAAPIQSTRGTMR